jgi:hypothetical protein
MDPEPPNDAILGSDLSNVEDSAGRMRSSAMHSSTLKGAGRRLFRLCLMIAPRIKLESLLTLRHLYHRIPAPAPSRIVD